MRVKEREKRQLEVKRVKIAELRHASKLYKEKIAQEKREAREVAKKVKEKEKAEAAACKCYDHKPDQGNQTYYNQ